MLCTNQKYLFILCTSQNYSVHAPHKSVYLFILCTSQDYSVHAPHKSDISVHSLHRPEISVHALHRPEISIHSVHKPELFCSCSAQKTFIPSTIIAAPAHNIHKFSPILCIIWCSYRAQISRLYHRELLSTIPK